jgi:hypothetical protein
MASEVSEDTKLRVGFSQTLEVCDLTKELAQKWRFVAEIKRSPVACVINVLRSYLMLLASSVSDAPNCSVTYDRN